MSLSTFQQNHRGWKYQERLLTRGFFYDGLRLSHSKQTDHSKYLSSFAKGLSLYFIWDNNKNIILEL